MNWREVLSTAARQQSAKRAFSFHTERPGEAVVLDYAALDRRARAIAADLLDRGLHGRTALLLFPAGLEYVATFFGCLYAGVIAVPAYPPARHPRSLERLFAVLKDCGADTALTTSALRHRLVERLAAVPVAAGLTVCSTDDVPDAAADDFVEPALTGDDVAFLQYTSGSTATPRGVVLSHANLLANTAMIQRVFDLGTDMRGVSWLPVYHDMGLIGSVLTTVHRRGEMSLLAPATFAQDPYRWLEIVTRERATVTGGPNFAYDLAAERITDEQLHQLDLSSWRTAYNGAEPIRARSLTAFADRFAPAGFRREAFLPCYGLAEGSLLVTGGPAGHGFVTTPAPPESGATGDLVGSGALPHEQALRIVDPDSREPCEPGVVGEIWISGGSVARGYWNRTDAVADTFGARLAGGTVPFLRTGDLGFVRDGQLFVTGRRKDLIVIRGRNHYPQDIEQTVETVSPILRTNGGAAFAVEQDDEERLVIVHEVARDHDEDLAALAGRIRQAVAARHEVRPAAVVLIRAASLPRTSSGKVARHACRRDYLDGKLTEVGSRARRTAATAGADDIAGFLRTGVATLLGTEPGDVPLDQPLGDLGLDSLDLLRLRHSVQTRLYVDIGADGADLSISALAESIGSRPRALPWQADDDAAGDLPPSAGQRAMWFLAQLAPHSTAHHISTAARVTGDLDPATLHRALGQVVDRHSALRTTFPAVDAEPVQRVHAALAPEFARHDATGWTADELAARVNEAAYRPFDLTAGPLIRAEVFTTGPGEHRLVFAMHHLVADMWSMQILLAELDAAYRDGVAGRPGGPLPPVPGFGTVERFRAARLDATETGRLWQFWRTELDGAPHELELRTDRPSGARRGHRGGARRFHLDAATSARLTALARDHATTPYVVLLSAYQIFLSRHTGKRDLLVGSYTHGRDRAEAAGTVGMFVNTAVLRGRIDPRESFTALVRRNAAEVSRALDHAALPFAEIVERLRVRREPGRPPLVQALFSWQRPHGAQGAATAGFLVGHRDARLDLGGLTLRPEPLEPATCPADVQLTVAEVDGVLGGLLQYDADLFDAASADRFAVQLRTLLTAVAETPDSAVGELPLLTPDQRARLLRLGNDTGTAYDAARHVHLQVAEQAARTPDAPAVEDGAGETVRTLTYRELDRAANGLAHQLAARGVTPGSLVGLRLPRCAEAVVAMLAVLKAGAAYLPLDPDLPAGRLDYVVADSGATPVLSLEDVRLDAGADLPPPVTTTPGAAAYVLYTSGSTGRPKGVRIPHRAFTNFLTGMRELLRPAPGDRLLAVTTFSFDISGLELFLPLTTGGVTHIASRETAQSGTALRELLDSGAYAAMQATPATWQALLDAGWTNPAATTVISGGEALPPAMVARLLESGAPLWNFYGPTETTVWSTGTRINRVPERCTPLGPPIANTTVHVLDEHLEPVPAGVTGEVLIGGDGLGDGYLGRPALTAERFVPDPYADTPGARLYRTGDLGLRGADGGIELLGRVDDQVKVNGHRIELGEIDAVLGRHPLLARAVTAVQQVGGAPALVAHVQARHRVAQAAFDRAEAERQLRAALRDTLPAYMVPARFVWVTDYPLTANGKVDRSALRPPEPGPATTGEPPRTPTERRVAAIVGDLLGLPGLGRDDNLFDHGAHSLMLSRFQARVDESFGVRVPMSAVFESPTVAALATLVEGSARPGTATAASLITRIDRSRHARRVADSEEK
ncbi:amino acid adenylation domain-containing protein [Actinoplanes sp. NPDC051859]|uniref:amino acid adenylation domain-containing protein n=1 Tax=Actinoplanes sp. NPDC051859 TaxID=3363909 RepID=UPI00378EA6D5